MSLLQLGTDWILAQKTLNYVLENVLAEVKMMKPAVHRPVFVGSVLLAIYRYHHITAIALVRKTWYTQKYRDQIVESNFLSVLDYGDAIYIGLCALSPASVLKYLDAVYWVLLLLTGVGNKTHHCILNEKVWQWSLSARRKQHCMLFIYMTPLGKHPTYFIFLLQHRSPSHFTRRRNFLVLEERGGEYWDW